MPNNGQIPIYLHKTASLLAVLLLVLQFAAMVQVVTRESSAWGVLVSKDSDGAVAAVTLEKTSWFKDNGFYAYGPLYYRLAHSISPLNPFQRKTASVHEKERSRHLALMLTSVLAFFCTALLLGFTAGYSITEKLLATVLLTAVLLHNAMWTQWTVRPHPDILLGFVTALAMFCTFKYFKNPSDPRSLFFAAGTWGLAFATKISSAFFMLPVFLYWLPPFSRSAVSRCFRFFAVAGAAYFLVGFPQNLKIWKLAKFASGYGAYISPPTLASVSKWAVQYSGMLWPPLLAVLLCRVMFYRPQETGRKEGKTWVLWLMLLSALVLNFRINFAISTDHYNIPLVTATLLLACLQPLPKSIEHLVFRAHELIRPGRPFVYIALPIVLIVTGYGTPRKITEVSSNWSACNEDASQFLNSLERKISDSTSLAANPYVPCKRHVYILSHFMLKDLGAFNMLALNRNYYTRRYFTGNQTKDVILEEPNWKDSIHFYKLIEAGKPFRDAQGKEWRPATGVSPCGFSIWQKKE